MGLHLKDKVVLITGGAKGIGAAIARSLAAEGAIPVIIDRDATCGRQLHAELPKAGLVILELGSQDACKAAIAQTIEEFGVIDALVNNAGVNDKIGLEAGHRIKTSRPWVATYCIVSIWRIMPCRI
jgi:L-fucose dehydrogenase